MTEEYRPSGRGRSAAGVASSPVTMADIANRAKVAESTVSRALSGSGLVSRKTRDRVVAIAESMGYEITEAARNMRRQSTNTLELVLLGDPAACVHLRALETAELIAAITAEAAALGYDVLLTTQVPWASDRPGNSVRAGRADGMIILGQATHRPCLNALHKQNYPMVVWGSHFNEDIYPIIGPRNCVASAMVAKHLLDQGRKRILFVGDTDEAGSYQKYHGYCRAMEIAGISPIEALQLPARLPLDQARRAFQAAWDVVSSADAIMCVSDQLAYAAMEALKAKKVSIPNDIAVAGFGDESQQMQNLPGLTTVRRDLRTDARALVAVLLQRIAGHQVAPKAMTSQLVVRASTCASA